MYSSMIFRLTGNEPCEVWLDGLELIDVILSLFVRNLPGVVIAAGLSLDLVGCSRGRHCPNCCALLKWWGRPRR